MKPKKYKLLKDLPDLKAGAVFEWDENNERYYCKVGDDFEYKYQPIYLESNPDWFEEVKEEEIVFDTALCEFNGNRFHEVNIGPFNTPKEAEGYSQEIQEALKWYKEERLSNKDLGVITSWISYFKLTDDLHGDNELEFIEKIEQILSNRKEKK
jgi:hypothetical protein